MRKKAGDPCPYCKRPITEQILKDKRDAKIANAISSLAKAKANGKRLGRPPRAVASEVLELRKQRYSYRAIAKRLGCAVSTVTNICRMHGVSEGRFRTSIKPDPTATDGYRPWLDLQQKGS